MGISPCSLFFINHLKFKAMQKLIPVLSNTAPTIKNALWIKPEDGHFAVLSLVNGSWKEQKDTIPEVTDITAIPATVLDKLNCGDKVAKVTGKQKHLYTVSYKGEGVGEGICLTYVAAGLIETVSYDYTVTGWVYNSTDKCTIQVDD
jgi:hypothetical protein